MGTFATEFMEMKAQNLPVEPGAVLPYSDPAAYAEQYRDRREDIAYYVRNCRRQAGRVLECGSGNGRVTLPLARAGVAVTGVDLSHPMLADLRARLGREPPEVRRRVSLSQMDMRKLELGRKFSVVLAPFDTVCHLYNRTDVEAFLDGARRHLIPGGRLIFDVGLRSPAELMVRDVSYDVMGQVSRRRLAFTDEHQLSQRHYLPEELSVLLRKNGFSRVSMTADFSARRVHEAAETLVVRARYP